MKQERLLFVLAIALWSISRLLTPVATAGAAAAGEGEPVILETSVENDRLLGATPDPVAVQVLNASSTFASKGSEGTGPGIIMTKTVGLDPIGCAKAGSINVPAGGGGAKVTYCYSIQNTGNVTVSFHTISDDQLGTLLGPDFYYDLQPSARVYFTTTTRITQTTVNLATWLITDDAGGQVIASDSDSAKVTVDAPTNVNLSLFSGDRVAASPVWLVGLLSSLLGLGAILRSRLAGRGALNRDQ